MHRDHAADLTVSIACSFPAVWGCQRAGEYAIKGRLIHATQPLFAFWGRVRFFRVIFSIERSIVGTTGLLVAAFSAAALSVRSNF
jgi:hypothetical protein